MDLGLPVRGFAIGFAVAAALGPVGLLVIRRTVERGFRHGLVSGLGVATADAAYGAIAALGLTALTEVLLGVDRPLGIVGGVVLLLLAARALRAPTAQGGAAGPEPVAGAASRRSEGPIGAWASMVALTLTNPATVLSFAALFASIGAGTGGTTGALLVTAGVFLGSATWWVMLTGITSGFRARMTPRAVRLLNIGSALVIGAFGVAALAYGIAGS